AHQELGVVLEPSGAAGLGALMGSRERFHDQLVAVILTGGNLTAEQIRQWLGPLVIFHAPCASTRAAPVWKGPPARRRRSGRRSLARFCLFVPPSRGSFLRVSYDIDPLRVRRGLGVVVVVPVPPLVRRSLGVTLWRVLPRLLTPERCDIEVAPDGS